MNSSSTRAAVAASFFFALSLTGSSCSAAADADATVEAHGRVHDPAGVPLGAIRITLSRNGKAVAKTTTDARGAFTLHAAPGIYDLAIGDPPTSIEPITLGHDTPPIDVAAYRSIGKVAVRSTTQTASNITHNDVPLANEPLTAVVVPPDVIASRGITRLDQTIETVSDIERLPYFGTASAFEVRGVIPQE
jgi:hypothetical protein